MRHSPKYKSSEAPVNVRIRLCRGTAIPYVSDLFHFYVEASRASLIAITLDPRIIQDFNFQEMLELHVSNIQSVCLARPLRGEKGNWNGYMAKVFSFNI